MAARFFKPAILPNGNADVLKKEQNTATIGLMWWWGRKQGSW